jgi:hypothetical protein
MMRAKVVVVVGEGTRGGKVRVCWCNGDTLGRRRSGSACWPADCTRGIVIQSRVYILSCRSDALRSSVSKVRSNSVGKKRWPVSCISRN